MPAAQRLAPNWWRPLVAYWFHELTRADWFTKDDAVDEALRTRFLPLYEQLSASDLTAASLSPDETLAAVLALDQLPRNLFRGAPGAFATDPTARKLTVDAVALGYDRALGVHERLFVYLPLEHSEDLADQDRAVDLIGALGDAEYTRYALAHRQIIARFGRFPHRNAILGRLSTPEEIAFLAEPGSSF
ncbi:MAG TPA: DUF924 family protein [Hyphomicrobium sp.]|nr:DUF924 family protein [Hyphomicrobium sp.]